MKINDFVAPPTLPLADFSVATDAPSPPEMPPEVHAAFSLTQLLERSMKAMNRNLENSFKLSSGTSKVLDGAAAGGAAQQAMLEFAEQCQAKHTRSQMWSQQVRQCGSVMSHCMSTLPAEQQQELVVGQERILAALLRRPAPPEIADQYRTELTSSNEFFDKMLDLIDLIKNGYLAGYEYILKAYSDFFTDFNEDITAMMGEWVFGGTDDGKAVNLNVSSLLAALDVLFRKYSHPSPNSVLYPEPKKGGVSREEAENWRTTLGLPESCLKQNADGTYCVVMDLEPLHTIRHSLPSNGEGWVTWNNAKFQAWQTGYNAQDERLKNMLQSLTQKYSNANSYHDNFNKTLSSHLNQYADMLKAMLNF